MSEKQEHRRRSDDKSIDKFHKWLGTVLTVGVLMWGALAYYVNAEDAKMKLAIESRLNQIEKEQELSLKINALVIQIDKKLTVIEQALLRQEEIVTDMRELRSKVDKLTQRIQLKEFKNASTFSNTINDT